MNYIIALATFGILLFLIIRELKVWKIRALLSPGFIFGCIWILGALGVLVLQPVGLLFSPNPEYIDELNILVSFTALCFVYWSKKGKETINEKQLILDIPYNGVYKFLSFLLLFAAVYEFLSLGANINMGAARDNLRNITASRPTIVNYISTLGIPLSIFAGYKIADLLGQDYAIKKSMLFCLLLPALANLIFSVNVGGRVDIVYSIVFYFIGASFAMPLNQSIGKYKRQIIMGCIAIAFVLLFISAVAKQRSEYYQGETSSIEQYLSAKSPLLGALYGPIEYVLASYDGYQLRRVDAVDLSHLGYGQYTFNGFINWTLPFSGQLGLENLSIAKLLDIYYYNQETYDFQRELYYTTHSCFLTIIKDFGFWGGLVCLFFLTMFAHKLFIRIQSRESISYLTTFFWFYIFWDYWAKSNFYGTLSSTLLVPLYGFLIFDVFNMLFGRNQ